MTRILALIGSLRSGSVTRKLAETAVTVAPDGVEVVIFEQLADIPFYDEDADGDQVPPAAQALREAVAAADAVLLVTPEYNGSLTAVLKNAIDWLSRPRGTAALDGKPVGVITGSISPYAGRWARDDARRSVGIAGGRVVDGATASIGTIGRFVERHPRTDTAVSDEIFGVVEALTMACASELVTS